MQLDRYTHAILTLVKRRYAEWDESPPNVRDIGRPEPPRPLARFETVHGVQVPVEDEDWPNRTFAEKAIHALFRSPFYPLWDDPQCWPSAKQAELRVREVLGERLLPRENVYWDELQSDAAQSRFAFAGLAALHLTTVREPIDSACFVVDMTWMHELPVREGYERYGAAAYFDAERRIVRIRWSHGGKDVRPGDRDWEHAKFAWRSSVFVGITVADHLWGLHLRAGNDVTTATRERLGAEHPIRLLLKPYCFRTIAINHRATAVLVVRRGLPHRAFALTYEGLAAAMLHGEPRAKLTPFPTLLARNGTAELPEFPFAEDGVALYRIIESFVRDYLRLYLPSDEAVGDDVELAAWWRALASVRPDNSPLTTLDQLVDVLSAYIFSATAMHKHVGALREYLLDPEKVAGRILPGAIRGDCQGSMLTMILVAATGLEQPPLLSDFSHLLPRARASEARALLDDYMAKLRALSLDIDRKNRERPHPYNSFNPARLECSVSI
jgi:hypothetical protein